MARLVIGTNKTATTAAKVRDISPEYYYEYTKTGTTLNKLYKPINLVNIDTIGNNTFNGVYAGLAIPNSTVINMSYITSILNHGCYQMFYNCTGSFSVNISNLTTIADYGCNQMFYNCTGIESVDLGNLTTINSSNACNQMFLGCTRLPSINLSLLETISGSNACSSMFSGCRSLTSVDLSSLTTISGSYACQSMFYNTGLTSVDLSSLTTISGSSASGMFTSCTSLTSVDLSSLTTISGSATCSYMFQGCTSLTSVDLSSLETISGSNSCSNMFQGCTSLTSIYLPAFTTDMDNNSRVSLCASMFDNSGVSVVDLRNLTRCGKYGVLDSLCTTMSSISKINLNSLEYIGREGARAFLSATYASIKNSLPDIYFPMLTSFEDNNPFYTNAFIDRQNLTIHFRKDMQSTIQSLNGYSTIWSAGSGTTVVFDIVGTLSGADGNTYTRSEKNSVYASETAGATKTATGWLFNNIVYYTTGTTEPQANDTIYSDSACTIAVTTISSIA